MKFLRRYPEYLQFIGAGTEDEKEPEDQTPQEVLEDAYQQIRDALADTLLSYVLNSAAGFFEKLVVELLVKMGYGGSRRVLKNPFVCRIRTLCDAKSALARTSRGEIGICHRWEEDS